MTRVTNSMLVNNLLSDLNNSAGRVSKYMSQASSGRKYAHISDDPTSVVYSLQSRLKLALNEHYQKKVEHANNWLTQAETGLSELNDVLGKCYESCVDAATDIENGIDREIVASYIGQMRDQLLETLNSSYGNLYVFGGYNTTGYTDSSGTNVAPFTVNAEGNLCFNGLDLTKLNEPAAPNPADYAGGLSDPDYIADEAQYQIDYAEYSANMLIYESLGADVLSFGVSASTNLDVTFNGLSVALYTDPETGQIRNVYNLMDDLYNTILGEDTTATDISAYISNIQAAQYSTLARMSELGGRVNRLEIMSARYETDEINYTQMMSDAEDADMAEVLMKFKMAQTVYQAALSVGAYAIQPTLMDYLS